MKVIYGIGRARRYKNAVLTIGIFDGVHIGHQSLIKKVVKRARKIQGKSVVVTFHPHPSHVLNPLRELALLISLKERLRLLSALGVDICVVIRFSRKFSRIKPADFIQDYIVTGIRPREIFIGQDFTFGRGRQGDIGLLGRIGDEYGVKIQTAKSLVIKGRVVSSTLIRSLIRDNKFPAAGRLLNRPLSIKGRVVKGTGYGKRLGFPTANLKNYEGILPGPGVYAVSVIYGKRRFSGMAYIGRRPSFVSRQRDKSIEVHIFNFNKIIYKDKIEIVFLTRIREEKRFFKPAALSAQLKKDQKKIRSITAKFFPFR